MLVRLFVLAILVQAMVLGQQRSSLSPDIIPRLVEFFRPLVIVLVCLSIVLIVLVCFDYLATRRNLAAVKKENALLAETNSSLRKTADVLNQTIETRESQVGVLEKTLAVKDREITALTSAPVGYELVKFNVDIDVARNMAAMRELHTFVTAWALRYHEPAPVQPSTPLVFELE